MGVFPKLLEQCNYRISANTLKGNAFLKMVELYIKLF